MDIYLHRNQTRKSCHESDSAPALEAKRLPGKQICFRPKQYTEAL